MTTTRPSSAAGDSADLEKGKADGTSQHGPITPDQSKPNSTDQKPSTLQMVLLLVAVFLSMFLVAVDRTIISTAIPRITDEFNSLPDVGWYGSVYLLTCCAFQLLFGKFYTFYSVKLVLITSILIFEVASAICGAASSSAVFIVGRAISGVGAAGIFAGTIVSIVHTVPLAKRPRIQGLMGAVMGIATVAGPLMGGGFTSNVTWRWCFYINLPFGGVAMVAVFFLLKVPDRDTTKLRWTQKLAQLDAPGTALLIPGVVCLLLALQWGGQKYAWSSGRIITLLTVMGVLLVAFVAAQILLPKTATIPPRLLKQRSVAAGLWTIVCVGSSQYIFVYFLPIWFQSIKGVSAIDSGLRLLPLMLAMVAASIGGGFLNQKIGYYTPLGIAGACIMAVGAGLLTTLQVDTAEGKWIGFQVLYGFGMGLCFQTPNLAVQTVLPKRDVPMGLALMFFGQLLGAAVFVSVAQNVLDTQLLHRLAAIPGLGRGVDLISSAGATSLLDSVPTNLLPTVLSAYNDALRSVFEIGLVLACLAVLGVASLEWRSVLREEGGGGGDGVGTGGGDGNSAGGDGNTDGGVATGGGGGGGGGDRNADCGGRDANTDGGVGTAGSGSGSHTGAVRTEKITATEESKPQKGICNR
ncbi:hypothetical protein A1O3_07161 [Capronia epimyces CBS 606.96]|uniref:Major facilitator superfamily (MFS) profile domain-containing protein n=1 Tax=Capronia epimyces CBS 606.96 TaxID=1182542 RepID=W9YF12_9EURO|nr:uncharacterized protein A1O3_07161 [Capronia epimyces CBS 606.96]EXJ80874.1 hypothetical protein A1O3_07161 [Capronia epimyces CBS 606.96]